MRRRILAGVAAAAMVTAGTIAIADSPAEAHENCFLLHVQIRNSAGGDILHFCLV